MPTEPIKKTVLPDAGWQEYLQWLLGRRRRFVVRERSMIPTLMPGDTVLAEIEGGLQSGDIAIASHPTHPGLLLIKRVQETFYGGGVYLISDNTEESTARDSRHFGVLTKDHIIGRVTSRLAVASV
ncbi:MAG: S26 family signal peptidase [Cyanobacteria bacterium P01_C01_bin.118]